MKKAKMYYYVDDCVEVKQLNYDESCEVIVEEGLIHIKTDYELQLVVNKEYFISIEKIVEQTP